MKLQPLMGENCFPQGDFLRKLHTPCNETVSVENMRISDVPPHFFEPKIARNFFKWADGFALSSNSDDPALDW